MVRPSLRPAALAQFLLLWLLLLPPVPDPRVEAQRTWPSPFCPAVCEPMRCPPLPTCSSGAAPVQDRCRCCPVCPAAEGEVCGGVLGRPCAPGLQCSASSRPRRLGAPRLGTCGCPATGAAVCGSDGRTYPSLCALRAENRAARRRGALPALPVQKGDCRDRGGCQPCAASGLVRSVCESRSSPRVLPCCIGLGDSTSCPRCSSLGGVLYGSHVVFFPLQFPPQTG